MGSTISKVGHLAVRWSLTTGKVKSCGGDRRVPSYSQLGPPHVCLQLFFPAASTYAQALSYWGVFAGGFLTRPLGALIFGRIADK
jgi:hypothetical protein